MKLLRCLPRFQQAYRALETLAAREAWSRAEIEQFQLDRLNTLWAHARTHVPYYRSRNPPGGLPLRFGSLDEFRQTMPILEKATLRAQAPDFLSAVRPRGRWMRTSGSTATPMTAFWPRAAHLEMLRTRYRLQAAWGVDFFDRTAFLWGRIATFKPGFAGIWARWRLAGEDRLRNRIRLSAYHLSRDDLRRHLDRLAAYRPTVIYGYSKAVHLLAREAAATGFHCPSLRMVIMTAEPATPAMVVATEQGLNAPAIVEYGTVECGFLAGTYPDRTLRVRDDWALLETLPREDGRCDIVVTVLGNLGFPLIRYAVGDIAAGPLVSPPRGFSILEGVEGRDQDFIVGRSGRLLNAYLLDHCLVQTTSGIRRYTMHQSADGRVSVLMELDDGSPAVDRTKLVHDLSELIEGYPVDVTVVPSVPQTEAGKHRFITSELMSRT